MKAALRPPIAPMLAQPMLDVPRGDYFYEPKWDGFRVLVFKEEDYVFLQSRNAKPLNRYFPEIVEKLRRRLPKRCVLDGEIVIASEHGLDFEALLQRIHPAASRIEKLSVETPAIFVAFDMLAFDGEDLCMEPFAERRKMLERHIRRTDSVLITPATRDHDVAEAWFKHFEGAGFDGVVAKASKLPYQPGERVMMKVKHRRTADCVVGGFRHGADGRGLASLLLGLYDDQGVLQYVGVCSGLKAQQRKQLAKVFGDLRVKKGHPWVDAEHDGQRVPGAPSRFASERDTSFFAVTPKIVVEVAFDHMQGDRFRHATRFLRLRPDRTPKSCHYHQLDAPVPVELSELLTQGFRRSPRRQRES